MFTLFHKSRVHLRVAAVGNNGDVFYYHADHLGGANTLSDKAGLVRELTEYDPFGQVIR
ncbi:MAG: hypothetical protein HY209_02350, partial [Candidatus Omnitrophica bacterium]|nr:hypothetical protein [Candidatus Omnitrophota bacterium]